MVDKNFHADDVCLLHVPLHSLIIYVMVSWLNLQSSSLSCLSSTFGDFRAQNIGSATITQQHVTIHYITIAYHSHAGFTPFTQTKFLKVLDFAIATAGLPPLKGHDIHISATREYLLWKIPFNVVKVKGCWVGDSFPIYLCKHAQILAPYIHASQSQSPHCLSATNHSPSPTEGIGSGTVQATPT